MGLSRMFIMQLSAGVDTAVSIPKIRILVHAGLNKISIYCLKLYTDVRIGKDVNGMRTRDFKNHAYGINANCCAYWNACFKVYDKAPANIIDEAIDEALTARYDCYFSIYLFIYSFIHSFIDFI